jgi:hypothetical protein
MMMSTVGVTLFSEPDFKGKSCFVEPDASTYALSATGLDKIASVKFTKPAEQTGDRYGPQPCFLRLYLEKPEKADDYLSDAGTGWTDFSEDAADTGKFASARWLLVRTKLLDGDSWDGDSYGDDPGREIHETLPS